jgi:acyl-CoA thioesterase
MAMAGGVNRLADRMGDFERDTAVRARGDGIFDCELRPDWWVVLGPNGGYLGAVVVRALGADPELGARPLRSITLHYLGRPREGAAEVHLETERHGRSVSFMRARLVQGGRVMVTAAAVFADDRDGLELEQVDQPRVNPPEDTPALPDLPDAPPFSRQFDYRPAIGAPPFAGGDEALTGGWLRSRGQHALDAAMLVALTDAWFPAVFVMRTEPLAVPTLELTVHLRGRLPREHDWTLGRYRTRLARAGFLEEEAEIFSREGDLLAQSRQLALAA